MMYDNVDIKGLTQDTVAKPSLWGRITQFFARNFAQEICGDCGKTLATSDDCDNCNRAILDMQSAP